MKNYFAFLMSIFISFSFCVFPVYAEEFSNQEFRYFVQEGTEYWEKAEKMGSGKYNYVCQENNYTFVKKGKCYVSIEGYAILDIFGNVKKKNISKGAKEIEIPDWNENENVMVHIRSVTGDYQLGWIEINQLYKE